MSSLRTLPTVATGTIAAPDLALVPISVYVGAETTLGPAKLDDTNWQSVSATLDEILAGVGVPGGASDYQVLRSVSSVAGWTDVFPRVTQAAHGLTGTSIGKPLVSDALNTIWDDTSITTWPIALLHSVPDANTLRLAQPGQLIQFAVALLENGNATNLALGRLFWWDKSANAGGGLWKQAKPGDSVRSSPPMIYVVSTDPSTCTALVRQFHAQPLRLFADYTLTGTDVTNQTCSFMGAGLARDGLIFASGILISSEDATVNWPAGTLSWSGLDLTGIAAAGMRIQGSFEPLV